jgi:hypothetical protein
MQPSGVPKLISLASPTGGDPSKNLEFWTSAPPRDPAPGCLQRGAWVAAATYQTPFLTWSMYLAFVADQTK